MVAPPGRFFPRSQRPFGPIHSLARAHCARARARGRPRAHALRPGPVALPRARRRLPRAPPLAARLVGLCCNTRRICPVDGRGVDTDGVEPPATAAASAPTHRHRAPSPSAAPCRLPPRRARPRGAPRARASIGSRTTRRRARAAPRRACRALSPPPPRPPPRPLTARRRPRVPRQPTPAPPTASPSPPARAACPGSASRCPFSPTCPHFTPPAAPPTATSTRRACLGWTRWSCLMKASAGGCCWPTALSRKPPGPARRAPCSASARF